MYPFSFGPGQGNTSGITCKLKTCGAAKSVRFYFVGNFPTRKEADFFFFFIFPCGRNQEIPIQLKTEILILKLSIQGF